VLGPEVTTAFGDDQQDGQTIRINRRLARIGIMTSKGGTGLNPDDSYHPASTAQSMYGVKYVSSIAVTANDGEELAAVQKQIGYYRSYCTG
jgi:hypothetical protein